MKANEPKRKIFADAVDLIGGGEPEVSGINCVEMLDVDAIKPFRHHPFHLYEGELCAYPQTKREKWQLIHKARAPEKMISHFFTRPFQKQRFVGG